MDDMEQIRKQQGHVSLATECRQEDTKNLRPCDAQPASTVPTRMLLLSAWEVHGDGFFLNDHDHEFPSGGSCCCCCVIISFTPVLAKGLALHTLAKRAKGGLQLFARVWLGPWPFLFFPSFSSHAAFSLIRLAVIAFIMSSVLVGRQLTFLTGVFCTKHGCFFSRVPRPFRRRCGGHVPGGETPPRCHERANDQCRWSDKGIPEASGAKILLLTECEKGLSNNPPAERITCLLTR